MNRLFDFGAIPRTTIDAKMKGFDVDAPTDDVKRRIVSARFRMYLQIMRVRTIHHVALIYDARSTYDLKVMMGVAAYLQEQDYHSIYLEENALEDQRLPDLRTWAGKGIIANFD